MGKGAVPQTKTTESTGWLPPGRFPCDRENVQEQQEEGDDERQVAVEVGRGEGKKGFFHRVVLLATAGCSCDTEEILERMLRRDDGCL